MDNQGRVRNITDLARLAGVSPGTVSRALADSHLIAKKTRDRIQAIAREHEFKPNVMARNLRIKRTGAIGVLVPLDHEPRHHLSAEQRITLLGHLTDQLAARGHDLLLSRISSNDPAWLTRMTDSGRVDGVIVIGQTHQQDMIEKVADRYLPLVVWGTKTSGQAYFSAGPDDKKSADTIGFDDHASPPHNDTQISVLNQDVEAGAQQLVDMLFRRIAGKPASPAIPIPQREASPSLGNR